jgi:hypothetical protein
MKTQKDFHTFFSEQQKINFLNKNINMKTIKFTRTTSFLGRNGEFKSIGIDVERFNDNVIIEPITSRNLTGRAKIVIPVESISRLIKILKKLKKETDN